MGTYLNSKKPHMLFQENRFAKYFIDKSDMLAELVPFMGNPAAAMHNAETGNKYICITRPRRFGKTMMANMISSYFGKGTGSHNVFQDLNVSSYDWYEQHLNQHNVIHLMLNETQKTAILINIIWNELKKS